MRGLLAVEEIDAVPLPATINAQLRPYQLAGFQWLAFLWRARARRHPGR